MCVVVMMHLFISLLCQVVDRANSLIGELWWRNWVMLTSPSSQSLSMENQQTSVMRTLLYNLHSVNNRSCKLESSDECLQETGFKVNQQEVTCTQFYMATSQEVFCVVSLTSELKWLQTSGIHIDSTKINTNVQQMKKKPPLIILVWLCSKYLYLLWCTDCCSIGMIIHCSVQRVRKTSD